MNNYVKWPLLFFVGIYLLGAETFCMYKYEPTIQEFNYGVEQLDEKLLKMYLCPHEKFSPQERCENSPNGRFHLTYHHSSIKLRYFYDESTKMLEGHTQYIYSAALSPDNKYIVTGSSDKTVRMWEVGTGKCLKLLGGFPTAIVQIEFLNSTKFRVTCSELPHFDHKMKIFGYILYQAAYGQELIDFIYQLKEHTNFIGKAKSNDFADINVIYLKEVHETFIELAKFIKSLVFISALGCKKSDLKKLF